MSSANLQNITHRNHFVPQLYLKRWTGVDSKLWRYSLLVRHEKILPWKKSSPTAIGYHQHLYTRVSVDKETDEIETWLNTEFEMPAVAPLTKAVNEQPLTPDDWNAILRFLWMQHVRTPASFLKFRERQIQSLPAITQRVLEGSVRKLAEAKRTGKVMAHEITAATKNFPSSVIKDIGPGADTGTIRVEVDVGRRLWLWSLQQKYDETKKALRRLDTTILRPPTGMNWVTSDDPVVLLRYNSATNYDFGGGYGNPGTEILFPLSPQHLLYAKVGARPSFQKYQRVPEATGFAMQKVLIEHAHRMIFALAPDPVVETFHPRHISEQAYKHEAAQWEQWHKEQSAAEGAIAKP
jgi:Protein of unknown function (DUF4238)